MDVPLRVPRITLKKSSLFDVGKDTHELTGMEKIFYEDQCNNRAHLLSQDIDMEYEEEQQIAGSTKFGGEAEMDFINEDALPTRLHEINVERQAEMDFVNEEATRLHQINVEQHG